MGFLPITLVFTQNYQQPKNFIGVSMSSPAATVSSLTRAAAPTQSSLIVELFKATPLHLFWSALTALPGARK